MKMRDWPHSPIHRLNAAGAYMVTAGTYRKVPFFASAERLSLLCDAVLQLAPEHGWSLQAWAVFSNHYHFVALSPTNAETLRDYVRHLHSQTAREVNRLDNSPGRKVWFEYWDTHLTYQKSYFARLNYVHRNAVHHGLVRVPSEYPWCSAGWFERRAVPSFYRTVMNFPSDRTSVRDEYQVQPIRQ
jgi:putative transposase